MNVVPLLLLSTNDIDEGELLLGLPDVCEAYLVDSTDGGTGVCQEIFKNFMRFANKAIEYSSCCPHCDGELGCAVCMFKHSCELDNDGLMTRMGLKQMDLREVETNTIVKSE